MKNYLLLLIMTIFLGVGYSRAGENVVVGLSLPTQQEERWVKDMHAMQAEAKRNGVVLHVALARNNQNQQNEQIAQLFAKNINVLIVAPHDGKIAAPMVEQAHKLGIKVICYDRLILGAQTDAYVSFDNIYVGELMGEWLTKEVPKGSYILMSGAPNDNNAKMFREGQMKYIQPLIDKGDVKVVLDQPVIDWRPSNAQKIVEQGLKMAANQVDAVLAPNDSTAAGAIVALSAEGLAGKVPVTGMDAESAAAKRIIDGTQSITILKDTRKLGEAAILIAVKLATGQDISKETGGKTLNSGAGDVPSVLLDAELVNKGNAEKVLIDSGYLKREAVFGSEK